MPNYKIAASNFSKIYKENYWGRGSGASAPSVTQPYMLLVQNFVRENDIKTVVDVGCGDWQFSRELDWDGIDYHGFDVVPSVIEDNKKAYAAPNINFSVLGKISDIPKADLVLCKDVLQHLPVVEVREYLSFFFKNFKYAIVTNDVFPCDDVNADIDHGAGRALLIDRDPFHCKNAVLLSWTIESGANKWIKNACLILGPPARKSFFHR